MTASKEKGGGESLLYLGTDVAVTVKGNKALSREKQNVAKTRFETAIDRKNDE